MKRSMVIVLCLLSSLSYSQKVEDLFVQSDTKISWLGIDYSNVKLIGDFAQFFGAGERSPAQIKERYFNAWNRLILAEPDKYDIKGMLRKDFVYFDIDMMLGVNNACSISELEAYQTPVYTLDQIKTFVKKYNLNNKTGIGVALIAESLNKNEKIAVYHFVALNMKNGEILLHQRISGAPSGFGIRNYWAGSIYDVFKLIRKTYYPQWKRENR